MLRTNHSFLSYIEQLYTQQTHRTDVILKHFKKGRRLFSQHETPAKLMVIKTGITKCFFTEENDKAFILEFLSVGEVLGEIEVLRNSKSLCNVEAVTDVTVYACSIPYFKSLLRTDLVLNNLLLETFAERIVNTASRASYQQVHTIAHNLSKLLTLQAKENLIITKEDMAAYLGITLRSLNRTLNTLNRDNNSDKI